MDGEERLGDDLARELSAAQRPAPADDAAIARVRGKLMRRIAQDSTGHHTAIAVGEGRWQPFLPGIERKVLHEADGVMSYLLKFAPGAVLPAHRHPLDEECVVISGQLRIGPLQLSAGGYHRVPQGVLDADSTSDEGAIIFLRGASPRADQLV